jgi:hypothetical protein
LPIPVAQVLTNSLRIREVHNSFARSDPFDLQEYDPDREKADAYHFIAFCPIGDEMCVATCRGLSAKLRLIRA